MSSTLFASADICSYCSAHGLKQSVEKAGLQWEGHLHSGIDDARWVSVFLRCTGSVPITRVDNCSHMRLPIVQHLHAADIITLVRCSNTANLAAELIRQGEVREQQACVQVLFHWVIQL
jgi:hypothetical protein